MPAGATAGSVTERETGRLRPWNTSLTSEPSRHRSLGRRIWQYFTMIDVASFFVIKALESLAGAESEFVNGRYNNCASRCYYGCFQAAIAALTRAGIEPSGASGQWSHAYVPAQFEDQLIRRRKLYSTELRGVLARAYDLRRRADYAAAPVSQTEVSRALRRARLFVRRVDTGGSEIR